MPALVWSPVVPDPQRTALSPETESASAPDDAAKGRSRREALLSSAAQDLAQQWLSTWCEDLRSEGRRIAGGWPGTVPEARARVVAYFSPELSRRRLQPLSASEVQLATQLVFDGAKRGWARVQLEQEPAAPDEID